MPAVKYTDDSGLMWMVLVPDGTPEKEYDQGAVLGPPDLKPLGLNIRTTKALHNKLVENDLYAAPRLMGKRAVLRKILTELRLDHKLLRQILILYQNDYYGDQK